MIFPLIPSRFFEMFRDFSRFFEIFRDFLRFFELIAAKIFILFQDFHLLFLLFLCYFPVFLFLFSFFTFVVAFIHHPNCTASCSPKTTEQDQS